MRFFMSNISQALVIMALALLTTACRTDASVSLAECIGKAYRELLDSDQRTITRQCNIGLAGDYVAVLNPAAVLSDEEYKDHGLDDRTLKILHSLQGHGGVYESIYIIPLDGQEQPSRTTSQGKIVGIQNLIVASKTAPILTFTLEWSPDKTRVVRLQ